MKFQTIHKDAGEGEWLCISQRFNNGDWDYWLVLESVNIKDMARGKNTPEGDYIVYLSAVSPQAAGQINTDKAVECMGWPEGRELDDIDRVESLTRYGVKAVLFSKSGNNLRMLMREARAEAYKINTLFGFFMDNAQNRIGSTGWDAIGGDLFAPLRKDTVEVQDEHPI